MINVVVPTLYVALSLMVGLLGRKKLLGFWGFFLGSLILTPVMGFLGLIFFEMISLVGESKN